MKTKKAINNLNNIINNLKKQSSELFLISKNSQNSYLKRFNAKLASETADRAIRIQYVLKTLSI